MKRSSSRLRLAVAALLVGLVVAVPAAARDAETVVQNVEVHPRLPTWQDEVTVSIGVVGPCRFGVGGVEVRTDGTPTVHVGLEPSCGGPPPTSGTSAVDAELGHLAPATYRLRVEADDVVHETEFTVYEPADLSIRTPQAPYTDDERIRFRLEFLADNALSLDVVAQPDLGLVKVFYDRDGDVLRTPGGGSFKVPWEIVEVGFLPPGVYEIQVFDVTEDGDPWEVVTRQITVHDSDRCVPSRAVLCLQDDRFRVEVAWRDFSDRSGDGIAVPLPGRDDTGAFWFFSPDNLELTVKLLDGCGVNGHHWVFVSSGSTVRYDLLVTDTASGATHRYRNESGQTPSLIPDTTAFATCP